ncbi:MAG TPA: MIP/aquaporin family protein [Lacibacter sp.]|nr:MIP/aquaporin family protein [Lacibacter sp.]HMO87866.1 MIP/aquaporin family protein [Lacibacter sp.]
MSIFFSELIGTFFILLFGSGVVANVVLARSKGQQGGWIVIAFGWAIGVFVGVYAAAPISGAHLNPAITLAWVILGKLDAALAPVYIMGQLLGAMAGSATAWLAYKKHFDEPNDPAAMRAIFCTAPAIRHRYYNLLTEVIGTFALVFGVLFIAAPQQSLGALDALPVALLVLGIGLSLGGPTGYAINPARDLGPRIAHALLPIPNKAGSDWVYAWVPVLGPCLGALLAGGCWMLLMG